MRLAYYGVIAVTLALYFLRLGQNSLWDNSEPTYGEIVKELFRTHDWMTLHFDYVPWFIHPPLWFWITGASVAALGPSEFALRLPSALFGVLCVAVTYRAAIRMYGPFAGPIAALALATSVGFIVLSRLAILDTMLVFFMTLAIFWGYFALTHGDRRAFWIAVVAAALGTMTKGPIAVAIPLLVLIVYLLWARAWRLVFDQPLLPGIVVFAIIAGAWFALETHLHGSSYLKEYLLHANVGRALSPFENQPGPWWYYLPVFLAGFFPFIAFVPRALWAAWRARGSDERLLLVAALVPLIFFSAVQTKLPNYIAPAFPSLAILVGGSFAKDVARRKLAPIVWALALALAVAAALVAYAGTAPLAHTAYITFSSSLQALAIAMAVCPLLGLIALLWLRNPWVAPASLAAMMLAFVLIATTAILPRTESFKPMKGMAATVMARWRAGDRIGVYGLHGEYSLLFYTSDGPVAFVGSAPGDVPPQQFFSGHAPLLTVLSPAKYSELAAQGVQLRVVDREATMLLTYRSGGR